MVASRLLGGVALRGVTCHEGCAMGKNGTVALFDDIDGTAATETIEFAVDGVRYQIDLCSVNAEVLRRTITQWAGYGRRVRRTPRRLVRTEHARSQLSGRECVAIREWCTNNGFRVGSRGPLPIRVVDAFRAANA